MPQKNQHKRAKKLERNLEENGKKEKRIKNDEKSTTKKKFLVVAK